MTSLRLSHISPIHAGFTSPATVYMCVFGCLRLHALDAKTNELTQTTPDYHPGISWKGNGMT
jgi:hypothetical protein